MIDKLGQLQRAVAVGKDKVNTFGKYNYRTADAIAAAIKAHLPDGCAVTLTDEIVRYEETDFVKATATFRASESEATVAVEAFAAIAWGKKGMDPGQVVGAASSYARKYALSGLVLVGDVSDDDPDAKDNRDEGGKAPAKKKQEDPADIRDRLKAKILGAKTAADLSEFLEIASVVKAMAGLPEPMRAELMDLVNRREFDA